MAKNKSGIKSFKPLKKPKINSFKLTLMLIILFAIALGLLSFTPIFNIENIIVKNNNHLTSEQVIEATGIPENSNIFRVNKAIAILSAKKNSYIEDISITRKLPKTLIIDVKERVPKYMLQIADSYIYINSQGYMLEVNTEKQNLPILVGYTTDVSNIKPGDRLIIEDLEKMNKVISIMEIAKAKQIDTLISKIDISDTKNYSIELESEAKTAYLGDCSELDIRMDFLKTILEQEKGVSGLIFVNMDLNKGKAFFREQ